MALRLYNTLTKSKDEFTPLDANNVRMYVCGPTVYDFAHIGNARPAIVFDVLYRLLRHIYGESHVTYVRNITDVDDKINARALRDHPGVALNDAIRRVTETTYDQYQKDMTALGCLPPTRQPRATQGKRGGHDLHEMPAIHAVEFRGPRGEFAFQLGLKARGGSELVEATPVLRTSELALGRSGMLDGAFHRWQPEQLCGGISFQSCLKLRAFFSPAAP